MITGVVLAGGQSSRMGRDKAGLPLAGQTLEERTVVTLRLCFSEVIVVRQDDQPGLGPIGGFLTALRLVKTEAIFLCGCDMPFLDAAVIGQMARLLDPFDAVAVTGEPLHAVYATRILPVVDAQVAAGDLSMQNVLRRVRVRKFPRRLVHRSLVNINTPEEWDEACRIIHGETSH